jgi:hypothetical protein
MTPPFSLEPLREDSENLKWIIYFVSPHGIKFEIWCTADQLIEHMSDLH